jgi:hypothetical protein
LNVNVTYEIRADNLGGVSFDESYLKKYKKDSPSRAALLARFHYGVHVHTAHLTWGANHQANATIWDINNAVENREVVRAICDLLKERVYKSRAVPWDANYSFCA